MLAATSQLLLHSWGKVMGWGGQCVELPLVNPRMSGIGSPVPVSGAHEAGIKGSDSYGQNLEVANSPFL